MFETVLKYDMIIHVSRTGLPIYLEIPGFDNLGKIKLEKPGI